MFSLGVRKFVLAKIDTYLYRIQPQDVASLSGQLSQVLSPEELTRYQGFRVEQPKGIYLCGRYLIKTLLAQHLNCHFQDIELALQDQGKPYLCGPLERTYEFNLSHSGPWLLLAVSADLPVGVDLELCKQHSDLQGLAERVMTHEEWRRFCRLPAAQRVDYFHRVWVLKEAYTKLLGQGIWQTLHQVETQLQPPSVSDEQHHAAVCYLGVPPPLRAALAYPDTGSAPPVVKQHYLADLGVNNRI